eukprot:SAG11_NODE_28482_length_321_cov_0.693694_1_plen_55_part_10
MFYKRTIGSTLQHERRGPPAWTERHHILLFKITQIFTGGTAPHKSPYGGRSPPQE